jgi:solute:Na+ symporter, SSS family
LSKHTSEKGLLVGVVAGFVGLYGIVVGVPFTGWTPPDIAWPWYVVIGGLINIVVSWTASVMIDGFQVDWHEQTIPGQQMRFKRDGLAEKQDGWYLVPGRVDTACWYLLGFFVLILIFLSFFATLGGR